MQADAALEQRVEEHLRSRGESPRNVVSAALVAAHFAREQPKPEVPAPSSKRISRTV